MVKFLIMGVNKKNKGNLALLKTTMEILRSFSNDSEFILIGPKEDDENIYGTVVHETIPYRISFKNPFRIMEYIISLLKIGLQEKLGCSIKDEDISYFKEADIVINSGGDNLSGESGLYILKTLFNNIYAILMNKPLILFSESLGYPKNLFVKILLNYVLDKADLIMVRDKISYEYLKNNIKSKNYHLTADPVFLLKCSSMVLKEKVIKPTFGFNMSPLISHFSKFDVFSASIGFVDFLLNNFNGTVILIPHVYGEDSDLKILSKIYEHFDSERLLLIDKEYDAEELKSIIGQCDLFIGARMHATIAATSMFVPTVGIAYSHKMHGIIGEMLGLEDYIIDIEDLNSEILIEETLKAWENREEIQEHLRKVIPEVKMKAWKNGELVKELCDSLGIS